ncbi:DNA polymerase beta domain protein region [Methanohalobium evestigatum Z-7303]|uniref:protein adenylyltransferase n=1 Tax=Methanohalobium evestigatum (strain ATCC BAA-1072 / DSM 3721 / NBRC 107634 / OCM 161 / Z-7303) TaxID=644295 RepID=D7E7Q2_METEZ|nr:nucleotidyltransferase [Methanohalobium evestigatum]ADI74125.1 DNA polymerase beta domain protein region [Methanohalobium evestigatum Z-7303]
MNSCYNQLKSNKRIQKLHRILPDLKKRYPIKYLGIFGSYVRDEQTPDSDFDVLIDFNKPISLLDFAGLELELSDTLSVKVDLVSKTSLKSIIGKRIMDEVVEL